MNTNLLLMHLLLLIYILYFLIGDHNYDYPPNAIGTVLGPNTQECYEESSVIDIKSVLTAHHKGHFEVSLYDMLHVFMQYIIVSSYVYLILC